MSPCELTTSVAALANILAAKLDDDELAVVASALVQLGDTMETILAQRTICRKNICCKKESTAGCPV